MAQPEVLAARGTGMAFPSLPSMHMGKCGFHMFENTVFWPKMIQYAELLKLYIK